jgi:polysaccharide export outer membrane protein
MPLIGKIECKGKTRSELSNEIAKKIIDGGYINDAMVNIQFADMKVFVLGEVNRPGEYNITRDKITILEALAMAGDMTIYGNRENVAVIRRGTGKEYEVFNLNFLEGNQMTSPAFYLQQGDVVYIQPNKYKAATAEINQNRTFWISIASTLITATSLVLTIVNFTQKQATSGQ